MLVKEINAEELFQWLEKEQPPRLIDVRTPSEMSQAAIAKAYPLPLAMLPLRIQDVPRDEPVVFYCRTGARSAQACLFMAQQGYDNVHNLHGGIVSWARSGFPIVQMAMDYTG